MACPHHQVRRFVAEDFALHLGASASHGWTDLDEVLRSDTPAHGSRKSPVHVDLKLRNRGMFPQVG
jgi:hypothetical protein